MRRSEQRRARAAFGSADRVHLGCGDHLLPGWLNVDLDGPPGVVRWDLTRPLPADSGSIRAVFCEHVIEHFDRPVADAILGECRRILCPGGVLRLSTPDLDVLVDDYRSRRLDRWHDVDWAPASAADLLNEGLRLWGHRFVYDEAELAAALVRAGFVDVARRPWRVSDHAELAGLERRPDHGEIILEAVASGARGDAVSGPRSTWPAGGGR